MRPAQHTVAESGNIGKSCNTPGSICRHGCGFVIALCVASAAYGQATYEVVKGFDGLFPNGGFPRAGLIQGMDGSFYGTTSHGGTGGGGTVYKVDAAGTLTTLHSFTGSDGASPNAIIQGADGSFYGTTLGGGAFNRGTLFKLAAAGTLTTLHSFTGGSDGGFPFAGVIQATDGSFYGTTERGGAFDRGTVFKLDAAGTLTTLRSFTGGIDGSFPRVGLIQAADGSFYSTTNNGGTFGGGSVFKLTAAGTFTTLYSFQFGVDGANPRAKVIQASDGSFYGTTILRGASNRGTVFKLDATGTLTTLHSFTGVGGEGASPETELIQATDGYFYGTTSSCCGPSATLFKLDATGTFTTLHVVSRPAGGVIQATDGSIYGTTSEGGPSNAGTIFKLNAAGTLTTFYSFTTTESEAATPLTGVVQATDGSFYGTTLEGGPLNVGTVFKLDAAGTYTTLHTFTWGSDGAFPNAIVQGTDGSLYGTTGAGTIFKLDAAGTLTTLYFFTGGSDGTSPNAIIQGADGSFYGTTYGGTGGEGTIFKFDAAGTLTTLYTFTGSSDGASPNAIIQGADGSFYGTTSGGGTGGRGTIFKLDTAGTLTTLHTFTGGSDGASPNAIVQGTDGSFYGTTSGGGTGGQGTIFKLDTVGALTTLHSLSGSDGSFVNAGLIEATDGRFYGTAGSGGPNGGGVVFRLTLTPVNDPPVATNDSYSTNRNTSLAVPAPGVLGNDTDGDDDTFTAILVTNSAHGTLALNANGSFTYTPVSGYIGPDSFTYKANDGVADSNVATVSLTVTAPIVGLSPGSLAFGNQLVGVISGAQSVTLSNTGNGALIISSVALTGTNAGDFAATNTCGSTVAAGGSCGISVTFTPGATGARVATLQIVTNATSSPNTLSLSGTGTVPIAGLSPTSLNFGNQTVGTTSTPRTATLTNSGTGPLLIGSISLTGVHATDFAQSNTCGASVAPGASCTISTTFSPTNIGGRNAAITIADNAAGSPHTMSLTGTGKAGQLKLTPADLVFSIQLLGTNSAPQSVTVKNTETTAVSITSIIASGDFGVASTTCGTALAGGASCVVNVRFTPTAAGTRAGTLSVVGSAGTQTATLTGTGTIVSLSATTLDYGNQNVGTTSAPRTVTLTNLSSSTTLHLTSIGITGSNAGDFTQTNTCGASVAPGGSCSIAVTFRPTAKASRTASLAVTHDGGGSPRSVTLTGRGK